MDGHRHKLGKCKKKTFHIFLIQKSKLYIKFEKYLIGFELFVSGGVLQLYRYSLDLCCHTLVIVDAIDSLR